MDFFARLYVPFHLLVEFDVGVGVVPGSANVWPTGAYARVSTEWNGGGGYKVVNVSTNTEDGFRLMFYIVYLCYIEFCTKSGGTCLCLSALTLQL